MISPVAYISPQQTVDVAAAEQVADCDLHPQLANHNPKLTARHLSASL